MHATDSWMGHYETAWSRPRGVKAASCEHNMWLDMTKCRFADSALLQQLTLLSPNVLSVAHLGVFPRGKFPCFACRFHTRETSKPVSEVYTETQTGPLGKVFPLWATIHTFREFRNGPSFVGCFMSPLYGDAREFRGFHISSPYRGTTVAGCLMSPPCKEHICSWHGGTVPLINTFPCEL